ncbi:MAG TPA: hypothetical protein VEK08_27010 [Planctomycetota bacterium]|nr:hypothetical protein [Planctomycetota bacterium]
MLTKEQLEERLKPGKQPDAKTLVPDMVPCGKCDGVVYFGDGVKVVTHPDGSKHLVEDRSYYERALLYLAPPGDGTPEGYMLWRFKNQKLGRFGTCSPDGVDELFTASMQQEAIEADRPLKWIFTCNDRGVHAHSKYRDKWMFFKVEEGVWAIIFAG